MKIVIGTTSRPKIEAIKEAIEKCHYFLKEEIEIIDIKVDSNVSNMPSSIEENMIGAKSRAFNSMKIISDADFYIGMESGTSFFGEKTYLQGVVYIVNRKGQGHFGFSNMIEVPEYFHKKIYNEKLDIGKIFGDLNEKEVSNENGAFGAWSDDLLNKKDQFILAFLSAIPAFYNKYYKL